jgi:hypothetical protein
MNVDGGMEQLIARSLAHGVNFSANDLHELVPNPDGEHAPNGANSAIGSAFSRYSKAGRIEPTGRVLQSNQPHRKGGMVREWRAVTRQQQFTIGDEPWL